MAVSRENIDKIAHAAANKVMGCQETCVAAGMTLLREQDSFRKATPIIFRVNLEGLVSADDLKIPHSELALSAGVAGKDLYAFALTGTQAGMAVYDDGEGTCAFISGREDEILKRPLIEKINQMWEKRGPD
ncbi:unnamed protein product [marine sediment metagenome]|uniref:Uncharacterized protein n=1 Tax=marine sediment metagenome TaxID=412755 RepID=X1RZG2_9ZZZZ